MRKFRLRSWTMAAGVYVEEAAEWARTLTRAESGGRPGHYAPAMKRVARRVGVPAGLLRDLHYRPPKTIAADRYAALGAAFTDERSPYRTLRASATAKTALGALLLGVADRLAGEDLQTLGGEAGSAEPAASQT